ncbi:Cofilin/tropomyosin-type actin-binding protein [Lotmaria passim]
MPSVVCVWRGTDEIDNALEHLDESKVQLLFSKFPVGSGTFKRNKFIYVQYIGPKCSIVKRGQGISEITNFTAKNILGVPGFSTTDKASLSFDSLVRQMKDTFVTDNGTFSMEQIRQEYRDRLAEEKKMMHSEKVMASTAAAVAQRGRRNTGPNVKVPPRPAPPSPKEELPLTPIDNLERTKRVLESLRQDNGSINWAIFDSDPQTLKVRAYGHQGIFEMVNNLPDNTWLFGLFRLSFSNGEERQRRMIFFQWIGSNLKAVRGSSTAGVYPSMAKALAPFSYEIYLVGRQDLKPQEIINKCKSAFIPRKQKNGDAKEKMLDSAIFTEENYRNSMEDDQNNAEAFDERPRPPPKAPASIIPDGMEQSLASLSTTVTDTNSPTQSFDVQETIELVQANQGGLVWAIFEVRY